MKLSISSRSLALNMNEDESPAVPQLEKYKPKQIPRENYSPQQCSALDYLEHYKILPLLESMTASLVYHSPENPQEFLIDYLERVKASVNNPGRTPVLFDDANLKAMFYMFDVHRCNVITAKQYEQGMLLINIKFDRIVREF